MREVSWVNLGLGLWVAASVAVLHISGALRDSDMAVGIAAALVAVWSLRALPRNHAPAWLLLAAGLWILVSPWALLTAPSNAPVLASNALCGAVMTIFAITRFMSTPTATTLT